MTAYSDSLIDRIYDLRKALNELSFASTEIAVIQGARKALAFDDLTRERAAMALAEHAEAVAAANVAGEAVSAND